MSLWKCKMRKPERGTDLRWHSSRTSVVSAGRESHPRPCGSPRCQPNQKWSPSEKRLDWEPPGPIPAFQWDLEKEDKDFKITVISIILKMHTHTHSNTWNSQCIKLYPLARTAQVFYIFHNWEVGVRKKSVNKIQLSTDLPRQTTKTKWYWWVTLIINCTFCPTYLVFFHFNFHWQCHMFLLQHFYYRIIRL